MSACAEMAARLGGVLVTLERLEEDARDWDFEEDLGSSAYALLHLAISHLTILRDRFAEEARDGEVAH